MELKQFCKDNNIPLEKLGDGIFERLYDKGFYVTEHDVIRAMKDCGYQAVQRDGQILRL